MKRTPLQAFGEHIQERRRSAVARLMKPPCPCSATARYWPRQLSCC